MNVSRKHMFKLIPNAYPYNNRNLHTIFISLFYPLFPIFLSVDYIRIKFPSEGV